MITFFFCCFFYFFLIDGRKRIHKWAFRWQAEAGPTLNAGLIDL